MTEQELRTSITPCIMAGNTWFVFEQIKAYADARVAETIEGWKITREHLQNQVSAKDTEIAELKAQIRNYELRIDSDAVELDKRYSERTELNAEIKRLRDGIQKGFEKLAEIPYCSVLRTIFDNANGVQNGLESLLSPAPVTETTTDFQFRNRPQDTTNVSPKNEDQE